MAFWIPAMVISSVVGGIYATEKYSEMTFDPEKSADNKERLLRTKYKELLDAGHLAILDLKSGCLFDFDTNKMYVADTHEGYMAISEVNSRTDGTPIRHFSHIGSHYGLDLLGDIVTNLNPLRIFGNTRAFGFIGYNNAEVWLDDDPICLMRNNPKGAGKQYYMPGSETFSRKDFDGMKATMIEHQNKYHDACILASSVTYKTYAKKFAELPDNAKKQVDEVLQADPAIKPVLEQFLKSLKMDSANANYTEVAFVLTSMIQNNEIDIFTYREVEKAQGFKNLTEKFHIQSAQPLQKEARDNSTALTGKGGPAASAKDSHSILELLPENARNMLKSVMDSKFGGPLLGLFLMFGGYKIIGAIAPLLAEIPSIGPALASLGGVGKMAVWAYGAYLVASPFIDAYNARTKRNQELNQDLPPLDKIHEAPIAPEATPLLNPLAAKPERRTQEVPDGAHIGLPKLGEEEPKFTSMINLHKQKEAVHN